MNRKTARWKFKCLVFAHSLILLCVWISHIVASHHRWVIYGKPQLHLEFWIYENDKWNLWFKFHCFSYAKSFYIIIYTSVENVVCMWIYAHGAKKERDSGGIGSEVTVKFMCEHTSGIYGWMELFSIWMPESMSCSRKNHGHSKHVCSSRSTTTKTLRYWDFKFTRADNLDSKHL